MGLPMISVRGVCKRYTLGTIGIGSLRDELKRMLRRSGSRESYSKEFWALEDITFDVAAGEVLGVIGRNGAGKSTLLKILSRITEPSYGEVSLRGRVGSLLEVGAGFHPELSGRDNIYLNGAILGMSRAEITRKFDEIVAFSEVERFIDTPVKRYSSGMYVRLAFAVAAHLEPEILIIDEVLAVGDQQFQKKCLGKMQEVSSREGRTVLVVSHTMSVILQLAHRCVVLEAGKVSYHGDPEKAVEVYLNGSGVGTSVYFDVENAKRKICGNLTAQIISLRFPRALPIFEAHEDFSYVVKIRAAKRVVGARVSMTVFAYDGTSVGSCFSDDSIDLAVGDEAEVAVTLLNPKLAPGAYFCGVAIGKGSHKTGHVDYDVVLDTLNFEVCAAPGEDTAISHWCQQWGRIVFDELSVQKQSAEKQAV
jgi:lipopolysaccharide transport system ATP-binding protein